MKQVMLQDTEQFCLIATNRDQQTYQISVYVPKQIAPDEGFLFSIYWMGTLFLGQLLKR